MLQYFGAAHPILSVFSTARLGFESRAVLLMIPQNSVQMCVLVKQLQLKGALLQSLPLHKGALGDARNS